jgi:hypothetical protein
MKRLFIAFLVLGFAAAICLAAEAPAPEEKTLTGKVDSVTLADKAKGTKSEIVVASGPPPVTEFSQKTTFLVKDTTTIYDAEGKAITLDKIVKGETVKVKYLTTKEGVNEALSINVLKT